MNERQHREVYTTHEITYWKKGVASTSEDCDTASVSIRGCGANSIRHDFLVPSEDGRMFIFIAAVEAAYRYGILCAKQEIRQVLGIRESRL